MIENDRTVLRSHVGSLAIQRGGIVRFPADGQKILVSNLAGIIGDLDHFGMAGLAGADIFIGWICRLAPGIAACDGLDPVEPLENRSHPPEPSSAERTHRFGILV